MSSRGVLNLKFNDGRIMPLLGLGTWNSKPGEVERAVKDAIDIGYRHIDCAYFYQNEAEIGKALTEKLKQRAVIRKDLFITSKLWNTFHDPNLVEKACRKTLQDLGLEYLDLYLIHFPFGYADGDNLVPRDKSGEIIYSEHDYIKTWMAMENLVKLGLVRSIGVSNFNKEQIDRLLMVATIPPVTNQVECHPYLNQNKLAKWMADRGITLTAYSPLGSPGRPQAKSGDPSLLEDSTLVQMAQKYKKTPAQILIRYQIERGFAVVPKSIKKERLKENFNVFNFKISAEDIEEMDSMDCNERYLAMIGIGDTHKYYPFNAEF